MYKNHRIDITSAVIRPSNTSATTPTIQHKDSQLSESNPWRQYTSIQDYAKKLAQTRPDMPDPGTTYTTMRCKQFAHSSDRN